MWFLKIKLKYIVLGFKETTFYKYVHLNFIKCTKSYKSKMLLKYKSVTIVLEKFI